MVETQAVIATRALQGSRPLVCVAI